ncbi:hypothetical protein OSTOST_14364, partial [Ostertagia ostertagi]
MRVERGKDERDEGRGAASGGVGAELLDGQRAYFKTGATRCLKARRQTLQTMKKLLEENREQIEAAIRKDLGR